MAAAPPPEPLSAVAFLLQATPWTALDVRCVLRVSIYFFTID